MHWRTLAQARFVRSPTHRCHASRSTGKLREMRAAITALLLVAVASACSSGHSGALSAGTESSTTALKQPPYLPTKPAPNSVARIACPKHPHSTLAMESCAGRRLRDLNGRINGRITIIWSRLPDATGRRYFATAENAWSIYVRDECTSSSGSWISPTTPHVYVGGLEAPLRYAACQQALSITHLHDLTAIAAQLRTR
jgi:hypothetical protein